MAEDANARRAQWLNQNAEAFAAQSVWHERHGHPLADIISAPGGSSWSAGPDTMRRSTTGSRCARSKATSRPDERSARR